MKAARMHAYGEALRLEDVPEPEITGPFEVIVRIGGAGLCRTDLHFIEGMWAEQAGVDRRAFRARARERRLGRGGR
jgi:NAD+-dependent secondary alcohol dehydrogenase Adh1